jgi:hypothetical protein
MRAILRDDDVSYAHRISALAHASSEIVVTESQTFNLSDIDPTRIKVEKLASASDAMICDKDASLQLPCDEAEIGLNTRNGLADRAITGLLRRFNYLRPLF